MDYEWDIGFGRSRASGSGNGRIAQEAQGPEIGAGRNGCDAEQCSCSLQVTDECESFSSAHDLQSQSQAAVVAWREADDGGSTAAVFV